MSHTIAWNSGFVKFPGASYRSTDIGHIVKLEIKLIRQADRGTNMIQWHCFDLNRKSYYKKTFFWRFDNYSLFNQTGDVPFGVSEL